MLERGAVERLATARVGRAVPARPVLPARDSWLDDVRIWRVPHQMEWFGGVRVTTKGLTRADLRQPDRNSRRAAGRRRPARPAAQQLERPHLPTRAPGEVVVVSADPWPGQEQQRPVLRVRQRVHRGYARPLLERVHRGRCPVGSRPIEVVRPEAGHARPRRRARRPGGRMCPLGRGSERRTRRDVRCSATERRWLGRPTKSDSSSAQALPRTVGPTPPPGGQPAGARSRSGRTTRGVKPGVSSRGSRYPTTSTRGSWTRTFVDSSPL